MTKKSKKTYITPEVAFEEIELLKDVCVVTGSAHGQGAEGEWGDGNLKSTNSLESDFVIAEPEENNEQGNIRYE